MNRLFLFFLFLIFCLSACDNAVDDTGIVARVNGRPITLAQLEFQHDLLHMDGLGGGIPSVDSLRAEYGSVLAKLMVLELVEQELESKELSVTDEEVFAREQAVRADYPKEVFEQVLVEEYIDLALWRRQLRYSLAQEKFFQNVLRPQVSIDYLEADRYYKQHIKDFCFPESFKFLILRAAHEKELVQAVDLYKKDNDLSALNSEIPSVVTKELSLGIGQLSEKWHEILSSLSPGEASSVQKMHNGFEQLILLERIPRKLLDPTQAYPLVEGILVQQKLTEAFDKWLDAQLKTAHFEVSTYLLDKKNMIEETKESNTANNFDKERDKENSDGNILREAIEDAPNVQEENAEEPELSEEE